MPRAIILNTLGKYSTFQVNILSLSLLSSLFPQTPQRALHSRGGSQISRSPFIECSEPCHRVEEVSIPVLRCDHHLDFGGRSKCLHALLESICKITTVVATAATQGPMAVTKSRLRPASHHHFQKHPSCEILLSYKRHEFNATA